LLLKQLGLFYSFRFWHIPWQSIWAIILIIAGGALLFNRSKAGEPGAEKKTEDKKLYRSRVQKMVGGVCGGIAEYFEIDVSVIRILWVIGTLLSAGVGILVYLIMLIVFPEHPLEFDEKTK
jgi:phage shock protein PspC (stress-responsive transcriptional regulator)